MILAKFRHRYPQGSLVSELIEIDRGTYIVKALVQIDNIILATGLAGAATVEAAEDAAKERAIATLFLDDRASNAPDSTSTQAAHPPTPPQPIPAIERVSAEQNVNFSKPQSLPEQPLTPVTVPLKAVTETIAPPPEPEVTPERHPHPALTNSLFGDTSNAETATLEPLVEESSSSTPSEQTTVDRELEAMDFNEIKQKTDIEIKRLSWTKDQGKDFLMSRYGKRSRLHLTDEQLLEFLRYLETLPNPIK